MTQDFLCTNCGYQGNPKTMVKGSFFVEIALWFFFIIPGIIYTIWRSTSRFKACPKCQTTNMIPLDSPVAQKLLAK